MRYFSNKIVHFRKSTAISNISSTKMKLLVVSALLSAAVLVASSPVDIEERNQAKWESFKVYIFVLGLKYEYSLTVFFVYSRLLMAKNTTHSRNKPAKPTSSRQTPGFKLTIATPAPLSRWLTTVYLTW